MKLAGLQMRHSLLASKHRSVPAASPTMQQFSDETLFLAFQKDRDVVALSTLFARHADELLKLAVFLSPRPSDAEDLLQATFLSAIARAETYREGYRVMSWLCGILTNHARMLRRAERRRMPESATAESDHSPVDAALQSELRQTLARSIKQLGEPYRSVLTLHLNDGLNSQEISQRLERPAATVRKQMGRALQQLRQVLPLGLATGLVLKMSPAQVAVHAAEAAEFVDAATQVGAEGAVDPAEASDFDEAVWLDPIGVSSGTLWLSGAVAFAVLLVVVLGPDWSTPSLGNAPPLPAAVVLVDPSPPAKVLADSAAVQSARVVAPPAANSHSLRVTAADPAGVPHDGIEVLCLSDDGRSLPARLMSGAVQKGVTDDAGQVQFAGLVSGRYELTIAGSIPKTSVRIVDKDIEHLVTLPTSSRYHGTVTDAGGRPVAGATILVGESGGRGELVTPIAVTDATGFFQGSCLLSHGQVLARHPDYSQSASRRLLPGRPVYLKLEALDESVSVRVVDLDQQPVANCLVGLVPKSQGVRLMVPHLRVTDGQGCCTLPGPGARPATIFAQHAAMASIHVALDREQPVQELKLGTPAQVRGVVVDSKGQPLASQEIYLLVAGERSNEPIGPMLQLRCRSDEQGRFAFDRAPRALLQVRMSSRDRGVPGPTMSQYVVAGAGVDTQAGGIHPVKLVARELATIVGTLRTPDGAPIADHYVLAVPNLGTATHRMFRRRTARTDAEGRYELRDVAAQESYQIGVYPPARWWPHEMTWPIAVAQGDCRKPVETVLDLSDVPASKLTCQVLRPDGKPARGASLELRRLDFHTPGVTTADSSGNASFDGLLGGDYWLAVNAPGLGSLTLPVTIEGNQQQLHLGTIQLQEAARITVRIQRAEHPDWWVRVVGKNRVGDKFVTATGMKGEAKLPPLPPGASSILVHGPGIAPTVVAHEFTPGRRWIDVAVEPANIVQLLFPFALADNPFLINGPLHVRVFGQNGELVLEDYVGAARVRGRFDMTTGLRPGRYRVVARSLWNALAERVFDVPESGKGIKVVLPLKL